MDNDHDVQKAKALILSTPFTPSEHNLLLRFVRDSVDPKTAALYIIQRASRDVEDTQDVEYALRLLLADWKQLVKRCQTLFLLPSFVDRPMLTSGFS